MVYRGRQQDRLLTPRWTMISQLELRTVEAACCAHLAVHESLQLQLSDTKLAVLFSQTPAGLGKVDLGSPHHTHILWGLTQLQFVRTLQLEVLKTPGEKRHLKKTTCVQCLPNTGCI